MFHPVVTLLDAGGPLFLVAILGAAGLIAIPIIFVIEAAVMLALKWGPVGRTILDAIMMNLASTLLGLIGVCSFLYNAPNFDLTGAILFLVITWAVSIAVEGIVLTLLKRHPKRKTWLTVIAANAASYVVMFVFYMVMQSGIIQF